MVSKVGMATGAVLTRVATRVAGYLMNSPMLCDRSTCKSSVSGTPSPTSSLLQPPTRARKRPARLHFKKKLLDFKSSLPSLPPVCPSPRLL
jgi:hypothetical protein